MKDIRFEKYKSRGADYHWEQVNKSSKKRNIFVVARYELILSLIKNGIFGKKVLDVGCGDGVLTFMVARSGAEAIGIDNSKEAIKLAKERVKEIKNIKFLLASAYGLPFEDNSFDYIVSSEVIEHLEYPLKMLSEIKRVWNDKGKIIITTPVKFTNHPLDEMHYQEFFEEEFKKLIRKYFKEVRLILSHPLFWYELQNKTILKRHFIKVFINLLNIIFGFNPFDNTEGWKYYTSQTAIISE